MTTEIDAEGLEAAIDAGAIDAPYGSMTYVWQIEKAIAAYLATTRTSEAEPVAWLHLPTGNVFGNDADYRKRLDAWKRQFGEHVIHDFEPLGRITLPTPASDDQVEAVRDVNAFAAAAMDALVAYEADYGGPLPDDHELGRIEDSRGSPSFRIRVGHIRRLAAMGSAKK